MGISREYFDQLAKAVMLDQAAVVIPISTAKQRAAKFVAGAGYPLIEE